MQLSKIARNVVGMPAIVVCGSPEDDPDGVYRKILLDLHPELRRECADLSVQKIFEKVVLNEYGKQKQVTGKAGANLTTIAVHPYTLFPEDADSTDPQQARADLMISSALEQIMNLAKGQVLEILVGFAKKDAELAREGLQRVGTYEKTRFLRFGGYNPETRDQLRYTYLEHDQRVRDAFVTEFIRGMKEPHNICLRTPNMESGPRFGDIAATILSDIQDYLYRAKTGQIKEKRHVEAKRQ